MTVTPPPDRSSRPIAGSTRALAAVGLLWLAGCGGADALRTLELSGPTMGTTWSVKLVVAGDRVDGDERAALDGAIRDLLARINALVSTWDPESELSRFNRSNSLDPVTVEPETFELFRWAVELSAQTGGAVDATVAPLVEAWGFGPDGGAAAPPDEAALAALRALVGVQHLELDEARRSVRKRRAGVRCDFSAFAPGYAADRVAAVLTDRGFAHFLVDIGGELVARGRNEAGEPWQVAVEQPVAQGRAVARVIPLADAAIATSGDYRNYQEAGGQRLTHILNPVSGRPVRHTLASATVIDPLAVRADGLATALMVLGPDEGMALAERLALPAVLIVRTPDGGFLQRTSTSFNELTGR